MSEDNFVLLVLSLHGFLECSHAYLASIFLYHLSSITSSISVFWARKAGILDVKENVPRLPYQDCGHCTFYGLWVCFSHSMKGLLLPQVNDPVTIISSVLGYLNRDGGWGNGSKGKEESVQVSKLMCLAVYRMAWDRNIRCSWLSS